MLKAVVGFGVLAQDFALIAGLLQPLDRTVARAAHGTGKRTGTASRGEQHWIIAAPRSMNGGAVMQSAHINVHGRRRWLA